MVLQDWVRGRIPFFIPPPRTDDANLEEAKPSTSKAAGATEFVTVTPPETDEQKAAKVAAAALADMVAKQRMKKVPVKDNFFNVEDAHPDGEKTLAESEAEDDEMASEDLESEEGDGNDIEAGVAPGQYTNYINLVVCEVEMIAGMAVCSCLYCGGGTMRMDGLLSVIIGESLPRMRCGLVLFLDIDFLSSNILVLLALGPCLFSLSNSHYIVLSFLFLLVSLVGPVKYVLYL